METISLPPFFEGKYERQGDCLIWTAATAGPDKNKYGYTRIPGKRYLGTLRAHRVAWEHANNATIPDGMFVLHSCDVSLCVNPQHLRVGTAKENTKDMMDRGRYVPYKGGRHPAEFCKRGHKMEGNRVKFSNGNIRCGICLENEKEARRVRA